MKKITVISANRAEYGLLRPVIKTLKEKKNIDVRIAVTGAHLAKEYGYTYKEIERDGVEIDEKIDILSSDDDELAISQCMAKALVAFTEYFTKTKPDAVMILGDRYEMLAIAIAALNTRTPIVHLHGGETTEGAVDEAIRHSITKMSYLHFTSTDAYRRRVIQLGEDPKRVFCVGALGVENVLNTQLLSKDELEKELKFNINDDYALVTYHPVTLESEDVRVQCQALLDAMDEMSDLKFVVTKANPDVGGKIINQMMEEYACTHENVKVFNSLGTVRYLSAVKYAVAVIGNSSSGIIEVPSLKVPTVNIGNRQRGRIQSESVINCQAVKNNIVQAVNEARSSRFINICKNAENPYGNGTASAQIAKYVERFLSEPMDLRKTFYDIYTGDV